MLDFTRYRRFAPFLPAAVALLMAVPLAIYWDIPQRDVLTRYAPMAEALAAGEWQLAVHPRIPPLVPWLAGAVAALLPISGFVALKIVSVTAYVLTVFPLWAIFRRTFNEKAALAGCFFYVFCSHIVRLSMSGLRENVKCFLLVLAAYGLILAWQERKRLAGYLIFGVAGAGMAMTRDDSILVALLLGIALLVHEAITLKRFPWRSLTAGILALFLFLPVLVINYRQIGYPVPSFRFVPYMRSWLPEYAFTSKPATEQPPAKPTVKPTPKPTEKPALKPVAKPVPKPVVKPVSQPSPPTPSPEHEGTLWEYLASIAYGFYFYFTIASLVMIVLRIRRKEWRGEETILLSVIFGHTALILLQIWIADHKLEVSSRYLLPSAPLAFGWTALMAFQLYDWSRLFFRRKWCLTVVVVLIAGAAVGLFFDAIGPLLKKYHSRRHAPLRRLALQWSDLIRMEYTGPARREPIQLDLISYKSFRRPLVSCAGLEELGYLSGGECLEITPEDSVRQRIPADYLAGNYPLGAPIPQFRGYRVRLTATDYDSQFVLWERIPSP